MPRGILKTASSRDKALPEIPGFPALVEVNTKLNSLRPGSGLSSSNFYPNQGPASRVVSSQRSRFAMNDSEDDNLWTLTTNPSVEEPAHGTQKGGHRKRRPSEPLPLSNCMQGNRYHSSMSSRASSFERRPRTRPRRNPSRRGYGSSTHSNATPRTPPYELKSIYALHPATASVEELKPVTGLSLSKREVRGNKATPAPKSSLLLPRNPSSFSRPKDCVGSSPLLLSSTKSNLRRRPRVEKRGSMSETDPGHDEFSSFLSTLNLSSLDQKRSTTGNSNKSYHLADLDVTPTMGKRGSRRLSNAHKQIGSPISIHSLPLILPAHAECKCCVEWESDKDPQIDNDEAGSLWKKLEKECAISPAPHSPGRDLLHVKEHNFDELELNPRRGRWRVKVVQTPTTPSVVPAQRSPCEMAQPPFSEHTWADGDLKFSEHSTNINSDSVPVLREVSIIDLLPPLSAYAYLSSLMTKRISRRRHRARHRRSSTLASRGSKARLSRTKKGQYIVHRDVKRALYGIWENCEDGWADEEQHGGAALWNSHMAMLMSRSRSKRISNSSMRRGLSGNRPDKEMSPSDCPHINLGEGVTGLGITMNRSATLKSRTTTMGADSVIDFYLGTCET